MRNSNLWRKAESANQTLINHVNFKSVKRESTLSIEKVAKKKVPVFKQTQKFQQKRVNGKTNILDPKNAENELK